MSLFKKKIYIYLDERDRGGLNNKDRKSMLGKKTRWGSNDDRVTIDMLVQSAKQFSMNMNNQEKPLPLMNFYTNEAANEINKNSDENQDKTKKNTPLIIKKDIDLRLLLPGGVVKKTPQIVDLPATIATKFKIDEESDRDEEMSLVIEMPTDDENKTKTQGRAFCLNFVCF